jgi:two-component system, NtrC family, sensor kinase
MLNLIISIISSRFIRKHLKTNETLPQWDFLLDKTPYIAAVIFILSHAVNDRFWPTFNLLWFLVFAFIFHTLWLLKENRIAKIMLWAATPFMIFNTLNDLFRYWTANFYQKYDDYFDFVWLIVFLWMAAFSIGASNQRKALAKEEAKTQEALKQKQSLEVLVSERTAEISKQKEELEDTLEELKETQTQLIQREKMASLGELTAGIAHEIQNPLNFVNNFAELSVDLAKELKEELDKLDIPAESRTYITEILGDLTQNQDKINHHGKRASNIVKGMLEHSRTHTGTRELTDVNELIEEFLPLSYHGMRAKDKSFNATFKMDLDKSIGKITVVPQDIGRVLLNLFNNAFYAVNEKNKNLSIANKSTYTPSVSVTTKRIKAMEEDEDDILEIRVIDNGDGIPEAIRLKIFQPFFTTKPTGEGTGLGLSLSYDIVTKGHSGSLEVESEPNIGTTFIIKLPCV